MASFLQIIYPHLPRISDHHLVKSMASELRKSAPNLPKYVETIPLDPLFLYLIRLYQSGSRFDTMPLIDLRDIAMLLVRVKVHSVSLKVFKVYYDLPKGGESSGGVESLDGEAAARLLLDLQPRSVPSSPPVSRAQPLLANG